MKRYGCVNAERLIVNEKGYSIPLESAPTLLCLPHGTRLMNRLSGNLWILPSAWSTTYLTDVSSVFNSLPLSILHRHESILSCLYLLFFNWPHLYGDIHISYLFHSVSSQLYSSETFLRFLGNKLPIHFQQILIYVTQCGLEPCYSKYGLTGSSNIRITWQRVRCAESLATPLTH